MRNAGLLLILLAISSCSPKHKSPETVIVKGVITYRYDNDRIVPALGSSVYALKTDLSDASYNDSLLSRFNWIHYAYLKYLELNSYPEIASDWKHNTLERDGIKSKIDYDSARQRTFRYAEYVKANHNSVHTTINGSGEYSMTVDKGVYYFVIESTLDAGLFYGQRVFATDSITDFSQQLWYYK